MVEASIISLESARCFEHSLDSVSAFSSIDIICLELKRHASGAGFYQFYSYPYGR
jgi:hypothetical protein